MADEKSCEHGGVEGFYVGERYEGIGPGLGCLHDARRLDTGKPALLLFPGGGVHWQLEGSWRVRLSCRPKPPAATLEVVQAPASGDVTELADMLVLMTAAIERVEDTERLRNHLLGSRWLARLRQIPPRIRALAGLSMLVLGLGVWLYERGGVAPQQRAAPEPVSDTLSQTNAPNGVDLEASETSTVSYPMPAKPFLDQAVAPCQTRKGAVEINGGCWVALEQRPPCLEDQAEHQGKCYLPVIKKSRPAQSLDPKQ